MTRQWARRAQYLLTEPWTKRLAKEAERVPTTKTSPSRVARPTSAKAGSPSGVTIVSRRSGGIGPTADLKALRVSTLAAARCSVPEKDKIT
jgi:hypothetical protein